MLFIQSFKSFPHSLWGLKLSFTSGLTLTNLRTFECIELFIPAAHCWNSLRKTRIQRQLLQYFLYSCHGFGHLRHLSAITPANVFSLAPALSRYDLLFRSYIRKSSSGNYFLFSGFDSSSSSLGVSSNSCSYVQVSCPLHPSYKRISLTIPERTLLSRNYQRLVY